MALSKANTDALRKLQEHRAVRVMKDAADDGGVPVMTPDRIKLACIEADGFETPELNDKLYLHFGGFRRIENLEPYTGVTALWLGGNGLTRIEGLDHMTQLRSLFMQQNSIRSMEGLAALTTLVTLDLSGNCIAEVTGLAGLPALTTLVLAKNALASPAAISHLATCPALTNVDLSENTLPADPDGGVLAVLAAMPRLATLYLKGNPLVADTRHYRKAVLTAMPALQYLDDRPVFDVERVAVAAWKAGGREAEAAARLAYEEEQRAAAKASSDRFRTWADDTRTRRVAELAAHNAALRERGEAEVAELPRKSYVSYTRVSDRYVGEELRMKRLIERAAAAVVPTDVDELD